MTAQADFTGMNASALSLSNTTETHVLAYTAPSDEDIDCILQDVSFGAVGGNGKKVIWRVYLGNDALGGSPTAESLVATGRGTSGSKGTLQSGGTIPATKGNMVLRESLSQQSGYTSPMVLGIAKNTRMLVTAQLQATDTAEVYCRLHFRKPSL